MRRRLRRQMGWTIVEMLVALFSLAVLGLIIAGFVVLWHFVSKYW